MSSGFAKPIKIIDAIENIVERKYLLPAIQRRFVWSSDKVESLFDSILRGYPINSFMFWSITDDRIKNKFKFYEFLTTYREVFKVNNTDIDTKGLPDFYAVIDGQQRLTSIYLGLKGSYAYKLPRKWWKDDEESLPTRWLYIDILNKLPEDNERQMKYDIRFLTIQEYKHLSQNPSQFWFKFNDILQYKDQNKLLNFILSQPWGTNEFARNTVWTIWKKVFDEDLINFYLEESQDIDTVLDIFIRTNSGGEPLSFSNLLMSITTASWKRDARKVIPETVTKVFGIGNPGFLINDDFVLKTCLVLFNDNIKFQVKNFDRSSVAVFDKNWDRIYDSILAAFTLLASWGFNDSSLRAKNAVIPIIYYIYHNNLEKEINNKAKHVEEKKQIRKWLCISLLKGVFGGQSDTVLSGIRKVLRNHLHDGTFPFEDIKDEFKSNPAKNLSFEEEFIDGILTIQKDAPNCYPVLALLYSHLNFETQTFHKDHLHPASYFQKLKKNAFADEVKYAFYKDINNWNSISNLQLLNSALNESKQDLPLKEWVKAKRIDLDNQLIPKDVSLDVVDFEDFISKRQNYLKEKLKEIIGISGDGKNVQIESTQSQE